MHMKTNTLVSNVFRKSEAHNIPYFERNNYKNKGKKRYFIIHLLILSYTTIHRNQLFTTKFAKAIRASKVSFPDGII